MELRPRRQGESSFRLLTHSMREQVHPHEYGEDQALPTEFALVREHGLSRQTVRRALPRIGRRHQLRRAPGIPIPHVEHIYLDRQGEPLEYAVSDFLPVQYAYRLRLGGGVPSNYECNETNETPTGNRRPLGRIA